MGCAQSKPEGLETAAPVKAPKVAPKKVVEAQPAAAQPTKTFERSSGTPRSKQHEASSKQLSLEKRKSAISAAERILALNHGQNFYDHYTKPTLVSYGASCKVMTAVSNATQQQVACKTIPKNTRNPAAQRISVLNEIGIMKEVEDHPNAIRLLEVYDTTNNYYIVMDYCNGGELFEHITKSKEVFTERHAAQILRSLMLFLAHMHSKGMAHMDIKPENVMFDSDGVKGVLKVIDFGASIYIQSDETVSDAFGTVRYSSPEMAADIGIGQKTDVWSAGIVMYFMLCGSAPFLKRDEVDTLNYIKNKPKVKFAGRRWASISQQAKDCISAMLEVEADMRPTAQEVLQMPWLTIKGPDAAIQIDILAHVRAFANQSRIRRLLLGLMAAKLSGSEANRLLNQFYSMDSDFSGTIELQELARATKQALPDLNNHEVSKLFNALDLNHTGTVDVKEFFASLLNTMAPENQVEVARKSFVHLDRERLGFVTKSTFVDAMVQQALASGMDEADTHGLVSELEAEFRSLDANSDGKLSFEEFKSVLGLDDQLTRAARGDLDVERPGTPLMSKELSMSGRLKGLPNLSEAPQVTKASERGPSMEVEGASIVRLALAFQENQKQHAGARQASMEQVGGGMCRNASMGRIRIALPGGREEDHENGDEGRLTGEGGVPGSRSVSAAAAAAAMTAAVAATAAAGAAPGEDEALALADLEADDAAWPLDPATLERRQQRAEATVSNIVKRRNSRGSLLGAWKAGNDSNSIQSPRRVAITIPGQAVAIPGQV